MIALKIDIDPNKVFDRQLTELEKSQIPFATMQAANVLAAKIHYQWRDVAGKVFDRPTQFTRTAALYRKGTKRNPVATVFIRDEAFKGVPPAKYLQAQVFGGGRAMKGIEKRLSANGILPDGLFIVPGKGAQLDASGNIPLSTVNRIKSQLQAQGDPYSNESPASRMRREKREAEQNRGEYFAVAKPKGGLKPGVYQRIRSGFGRGVATIMRFVKPPKYRQRYDVLQMAQTVFERNYKSTFVTELDRAVKSTFSKAFNK